MTNRSPDGESPELDEREEDLSRVYQVRAKSIRLEDSTWSLRLGSVVQSMSEGLQIVDRNYRCLYVNEAAARHSRTTRLRLIGSRIMDVYPDIQKTNVWAPLSRAMEERTAQTVHTEFSFLDGSKGWFQTRFEPIPEGVLILSIEVTEQHELELQLRQAQKMEAIGRLAGGLAHDFNNLLTVILAYTNLLKGEQEPDHEDDLHQVEEAAKRATMLTRQLLTISRNQLTRPIVVSLNQNIRALLPMLTGLLNDRIQVELRLNSVRDRIWVDPVQLDQVLLNLTTNARDAMPDGGVLTIETEDRCFPDETSNAPTDPSPQTVCLKVGDTGRGMSPETAARVFEPFFTTKAPRQGTGLGLCTSRGIVREAGGKMHLLSTGPSGTVFAIDFPSTAKNLEHPSTESLSLGELRGEETVLLVESDDALREACARTLRAQGYTVFEAAGELEARELSAHYPGSIHALIVDLVLGSSNGVTLSKQLERLRPSLKTLYLSGVDDHDLLSTIQQAHIVAKPFMPETLARQLFDLLKSSDTAHSPPHH